MALAFQLRTAGYKPTELAAKAAVSREHDGAAFRVSHLALTLRARIPRLDDAAFARLTDFAPALPHNPPVSA